MQRLRTAFFDNLILASGGADGITLTLTPGQATAKEDGVIITSVYAAMKVDAAPGRVVFVDPNGALFNGRPSWELAQQYQAASFVWDGEGWNVLAFPNPSRRPVNSRLASPAEPSSQPLTR
jgi:hypothetical protein